MDKRDMSELAVFLYLTQWFIVAAHSWSLSNNLTQTIQNYYPILPIMRWQTLCIRLDLLSSLTRGRHTGGKIHYVFLVVDFAYTVCIVIYSCTK